MPKTTEDGLPERRVAFGRRLRAAREHAKMSQTETAAAAGLDRSYYCGVKAGRKNISLDKIFAVADALGVAVATLFEEGVADSRDLS